MDSRYILGIHGDIDNETHDTSVVLLKDSSLKCMGIEERYSHKKHDGMYPKLSMFNLFSDKLSSQIHYSTYRPESDDMYLNVLNPHLNIIHLYNQPLYYHHMLHVYESFYTSGFESAVVLVIDGEGIDNESISIWKVNANQQPQLLKLYTKDSSICILYSYATKWSGFPVNSLASSEEGKFMGLSSYNKPNKRIFEFDNDTGVDIKKIINNFSDSYPFGENIDNRHDIIHYSQFAANIQHDFTTAVLKLISIAKNISNEENLCLSGGGFQNVITNNEICESNIFKNVWCSPVCADIGISVGQAYYNKLNVYKERIKPTKLKHAYLGLKQYKLENKHNEFVNIKKVSTYKIASLLRKNKILGWFQGKSEIGFRALGHRSIIGNPSNRNNFYKINNDIKHREEWRPLAPSIPEELFDIIFETNNTDLTQFMLRSIPIKEEWRCKLAAVCHVDGTTRPHLVEREVNLKYYDLIMEFYEQSGIPCIINTSMNGPGQPIIETLDEAISFLLNNESLDGLVIDGEYLVTRKGTNDE